MSRYRRIELIEEPNFFFPSLSLKETSIIVPKTFTIPSFFEEDLHFGFALDLLKPSPLPSPFEVFESATDLLRIDHTPSFSSYRRVHRVEKIGTELYLQSLSDRVSELESRFDRVFGANVKGGEQKYTWTAEIKDPSNNGFDRKYKWVAEIKQQEENKKKKEEKKRCVQKNYKWTAEIKGKGADGEVSRTYTIKSTSGDGSKFSGSVKKKDEKSNKDKKLENKMRIVKIEDPTPNDHGVIVLRQAFAKRFGAIQNERGKRKELSPQDAAIIIQMTFRAYLIRRSQVLRGLRELAVAKSKLKELRALFNNIAYHRHVAQDAAERQRFSEKIIVLLLTVDAIEGADLMVRAAKRSMVNELEAMLDVVDPQPKKSLSMKRRTFDMPDGVIRKEMAESVAQVVQMFNNEENGSSTFEACL